MKKIKLTKIIAISLVPLSLAVLSPIGVSAQWKENTTGWWYEEGNSWVTGWRKIESNWYYFDANGYMIHDTEIGGYKLGTDGAWIPQLPEKINDESKTKQIATFADKNLEQGIRKAINKSKEDIYMTDVEKITELDLKFKGIKDISGIEKLKNLQTLDLWGNKIIDINSLSGLSKLKVLSLDGYSVNGKTTLEDLPNLKGLTIFGQPRGHINELKELTDLQELTLLGSELSDAEKDLFNKALSNCSIFYK